MEKVTLIDEERNLKFYGLMWSYNSLTFFDFDNKKERDAAWQKANEDQGYLEKLVYDELMRLSY